MYKSVEAREINFVHLFSFNVPIWIALLYALVFALNSSAWYSAIASIVLVLLWGYYVIPHWHIQGFRVAYWDKFGIPKVTPKYDLGFDTWWVDPRLEAALIEKKASLGNK